jgi:hypothetical protein
MVTSRIWFTAKQKGELWERWKNGQSVLAISRALERRNKRLTHSVTLRHASPHSREKAFDEDAGSATHRTGFMIYFAYFVSRIGPDHGVAPPATSFKGVSCHACVV